MGKGFLLFGLGGFILFLALALSLDTINISILGLDFTTMEYENFLMWFWGFIVLGFACFFGGLLNGKK